MNNTTKLLKFNWLAKEELPASTYDELDNGLDWTNYPFPDQLGNGGFEMLNVYEGMSLFHARHNFLAQPSERYFQLANVEVQFHQRCIQCQTVSSGRILHWENGHYLENKPGTDMFRYVQNIEVMPVLDSNYNSELIALTITEESLISLIGLPIFENVLKQLKLDDFPSSTSASIPLYISKPLQDSFNSSLTGKLKNLYAQSKVLEYLTGCFEFLNNESCDIAHHKPSISEPELARLYKKLTCLNGKLPNIEEMADEFGYSAHELNKSFKATYNESIFCAVNNARLDEAHKLISETSTPLKVISINLGYSHVNHFNNAFKKKFGYPPGSLRKKKFPGKSVLKQKPTNTH